MNPRQESRRIFWMVRLLVAVGLVAIVLLLALVARQIGSIRAARLRQGVEQQRLDRTSEEILRRADEARGEIIVLLDDNVVPGKSGAAKSLQGMIDRLVAANDHPYAAEAVAQLDSLTDRLVVTGERAAAWRGQYDLVWEDVGQQRTMGKVRDVITGLRGAVESLEGRERLREALQIKRGRAVGGVAAANLAQSIVAEQDGQINRGAEDLKQDLAEIESQVEQLGGEEQPDNLPNLKDNQLLPALDRLRHDLGQLAAAQPEDSVLTPSAVERLTALLFGQGDAKEAAPPAIDASAGGLYGLRRDILRLRKEREGLRRDRSSLSHDIDTMARTFLLSASAHSESLAGQVERNLALNWRRMMLAGGGCAALFFALAWWISRMIRGQVGLIEQAKAEAEAGRQQALLLTKELHTRNEELIKAGDAMQGANARLSREIAARVVVEVALAKNEEKERGLFAASHEALMTLFPPEWNFTSANAATIQLFGAQDERDFLTRGPSGVSPERQPDGELSAVKAQRMIATAMEDGSHFYEWSHQRITGEVFPTTVMCIRMESAGRMGLQALVRDMTEQKRAESALRASEERLRQIFEHASQVFYSHTADGRLTYVSPRAQELFDCSPAEALQPWTEFLTGNPINAEGIELTNRAIESGETQLPYELEIASKRGRIVWVEVHESPVVAQGRTIAIVGALTDITQRKEAEARQRAERERYLRQRDALIALTSKPINGDGLPAIIRRLTETDARTLGVARVSVWRYHAGRTALQCVDLYELEADRHSAGLELPASAYPAYFRALGEMEVIAADDACLDPRTCEFAEAYLRPLGITAMLDAPIHLGAAGEGVLCHEHVGPPRCWTADEESFAVGVANRVSLALESTERKGAEKELRSAHAQLQQMVAHSPALIYRLKVEGDSLVPLAVSANVRAVLGYEVPEVLDRDWWAAQLHPEDRERAFASSAAMLVNGSGRAEYRVRDKQGRYRWMEDNQRVLRDASGAPQEVIGVWMDITDRKQAEGLARESEERYRRLIENARDAIFTLAPDGTFTSLNPAVETIAGLSCAEWLGKSFAPMVHPDDLPVATTMFHRILRGESAAVHELRGHPSLRRPATMEMTLTAQTDADGKIVGVLGIGRDMTERRRDEERIRLQTSPLEATANGVVITDARGTIQWVNPAFSHLTGYSAEEVIGQNPRLLKSGKQSESVYKELWRTITKGLVWKGEIINRRKDGQLYDEEMHITPVRAAGGAITHFVAIKQDISERKRAEEALRTQQEFLAALFDNVTDGIVSCDAAGVITLFNRVVRELHGMPVEPIAAELWAERYDLFLPDGQTRMNREQTPLFRALTEGSVHDVEMVIAPKGGMARVVLTSGQAFFDSAGAKVGAVVVMHDITERKKAEDALLESKRFLRSALNALSSHIAILDESGTIIAVNAAWDRFAAENRVAGGHGGVDANYLQVCDRATGHFSREAPLVASGIRDVIAGRSAEYYLEYPCHSPREQRWFIVRVTRFDGTGSLRVVVAHENITERKRAEGELLRKTALLEAQVDSAPDGILVVDPENRQILRNERFHEVWKIPREITAAADDLKVRQFAAGQVKNPTQFAERVAYLYAHPDTIGREEIELIDGTVLDRYSAPVRDKVGNHYGRIWTFRDVTERKRAEATLQDLHRQLLDSSRRSGMAEIASNVLHNVGNVLNSVNVAVSVATDKVRTLKVGTIEQLAAMLSGQPDLAAFFASDPRGAEVPAFLKQVAARIGADRDAVLGELGALRQHIEHINEIVAVQQRYAKAVGITEVLPLVDLIEDALRLNAGSIERHGLHVVRDIAELPPAPVDRHQVLQILVNLISNAKHALDEGAPAEKQLTLRLARNGGDRVALTVSDNGVGIAAENLTQIFAHGFTTRTGGHGFGLHSSANAAREMGGTLTARSEGPGRGAAFTLELPFPPAPQTP